ncbi:MAG: UDP-N-acetylmuramate dehydrogenase [Clostridia bacterium]|nr:UDP-N-acetylmuramate dehydrogenase [Clostridia bacterium]
MTEQFKEISPQLVANEPMSRHTTFKIGGEADMYVSVESVEELCALIRLAKEKDVYYTVIGNGSNLLVSDSGIRGLVIEIGQGLAEYEVKGNTVYAQAGILLKKLASVAASESLSGLEEVSGVPGTLGGGIFMNAGAYGGELKDTVKKVTYVDDSGEMHTITNEECEFGYRKSIFSGGGKYIVSAELELKKGDGAEIAGKMADYTKRRREKQPISYPSAGSTFKRPEGNFAGTLIEKAGLKGYTSGGAMVSELHAGFVINNGGATAQDVIDVIEHTKKTVLEKFRVELEPEVRLIGDFK